MKCALEPFREKDTSYRTYKPTRSPVYPVFFSENTSQLKATLELGIRLLQKHQSKERPTIQQAGRCRYHGEQLPAGE
jgi:hypothetical protein